MNSRIAFASALAVAVAQSFAGTYYTDRTAFEIAAGSLVHEGFDGFAPGVDLNGASVGNASFSTYGGGSTPLQVILGSAGVRNPMNPSSGLNVLSPGGSDPSAEADNLLVTFATDVQFAGMDVVFDVPDGASFTSVTFLDAGNNTLFTDAFIPAPNGAPGYQFVGFGSNIANIHSMKFNEFDGSAPDDNVAYDTLSYSAAVPEPATMAILGMGIAALIKRRKA
ncbi:MAG: PEP-CTERM sorting domain-containing protein [Armatimonadetes bacterium]|nr:PEP-CTERM sorting domain-containing protein [Armatimonadota bacterium]